MLRWHLGKILLTVQITSRTSEYYIRPWRRHRKPIIKWPTIQYHWIASPPYARMALFVPIFLPNFCAVSKTPRITSARDGVQFYVRLAGQPRWKVGSMWYVWKATESMYNILRCWARRQIMWVSLLLRRHRRPCSIELYLLSSTAEGEASSK